MIPKPSSAISSSTRGRSGCLFPSSLVLLGFLGAGAWWTGLVGSAPVARAQDPAPVDGSNRPEPASVPFELVASNHMVVRAKINGQGPYRLVFDLGAPITLLGNKAGEGSGVIAKDAPKSFLMGMRGEGEIQTLEIGNLTASKIPVVVLDHPTLKALGGFLGKPLDGIMGFTFFARYRTTIDYQAKVMTFEPVNFRVGNLMQDLANRMAGPKVARKRVLNPAGVWGLTLGAAVGDGEGVTVKAVRPNSSAAAAGLRPGDVLTTLDGRWTATPNDTYAAAGAVEGSGPVEVTIRRDGKEETLSVTPAVGF